MNANAVLDEFVATASAAAPGQRIPAPWSSSRLDDDGQAAAIALIRTHILGATGRRGRVKLYLGRNHAGNPFFRIVNGWLVFALVIAWTAGVLTLGRSHEVSADWVGLALSLLGLVYFGCHGLTHWRYAWLFLKLGRPGEQTRLGSCVIGTSLAAGAVYEFIGRLF